MCLPYESQGTMHLSAGGLAQKRVEETEPYILVFVPSTQPLFQISHHKIRSVLTQFPQETDSKMQICL